MTSRNIIVFGPTGHVGSTAALFAQEQGAKVFLAMRDVHKQIPGIRQDQEQSRGLERVYADLTKPDTISAAIKETKATCAFIYLIFGSPMTPSIEALKAGGVDFVVFLSSHGIQTDVRSVPQDNFVAWQHAKVEIALEEVFGTGNYIAVRPAYFTTNTLGWKTSLAHDKVEIAYPQVQFDYLSTEDIGRVCGALLAKGPQIVDTKIGRNIVGLVGPRLLTQKEAALAIGKALGKELKIVALDDKEGVESYMRTLGVPEPVAKDLIGMLKAREEGSIDGGYEGPIYEESRGHILKFTGRQPTEFPEWVEENKEKYKV